MRIVLFISGFISLGLAIIGIVLPLLPTTPFLLLSAFCFAKSSEKFHRWLLNHRYFGEVILKWESKRAISRKTKMQAMVMIVLTVVLSMVLNVPTAILMVQLFVLTIVSLFVLSRKED